MITPIQELIKELKYVQEFPMISGIIKRAELLLEKEKEQIKDAWDAGMSEGIGTIMADLNYDGEFINYYNETYNENK